MLFNFFNMIIYFSILCVINERSYEFEISSSVETTRQESGAKHFKSQMWAISTAN